MQLSLRAYALSPGQTYTFTLQAAYAGSSDSAAASVLIVINAPPANGVVTSSPSTGTALGDEQEINVGAALDGLRYAWVTDQTSVGERRSTDLRIDLNLPFNLR